MSDALLLTLFTASQVLTDELRVRQIVMNGLTNAIKYANAPANGAIRIVVSTHRDYSAGDPNLRRKGGRRSCSCTRREAAATTASAMYTGGPVEWLCIDVLDRGPGLRGIGEAALFTDFGAPVVGRNANTNPSNPVVVGSTGIGLPICGRCALLRFRVEGSV